MHIVSDRRATGGSGRTAGSVSLLFCLALITLLPVLCQAKGKSDPVGNGEYEIKLGRENAAANDKTVKLVTDAAIVDRVNRIGQQIAAIADKTPVPALWGYSKLIPFKFTFKVVDSPDVNAYSLPGGFVYVDTGLLKFVHSDDELAGVLAHEISHVMHHHMLKLLNEQEKTANSTLPFILLLGAISHSPTSTASLLMAGNLYMVARMNSYSIQAEEDADHTAVIYLSHSKYNPVGLLTFMERLARKDSLGPEQNLGYLRNHPTTPARVQALIAELNQLHIPLERTVTDPALAAQVANDQVDGVHLAKITMNKVVIARLSNADGMTAKERADKVSITLNNLFNDNLQLYELNLNPQKDAVVARGQTIIAFTPADAKANNETVTALAQGALDAIKNVIWKQQLDNTITNTPQVNPN